MFHPINDESETRAAAPLRGLMIAAPIALLLWVGVAELASTPDDVLRTAANRLRRFAASYRSKAA